MSQPHIPVMMNEVIAVLQPQAGETYVDGTFGAGGYTKNFLDAAKCNVIAFDRDPTAIASGQELLDQYKGRLSLIHKCFGDVAHILNEKVDGFILDIGVSSMQLDQAERGFSFMRDGPLDMRMHAGGTDESAMDLIARIDEGDLADLIFKYGEDRHARRIARAIVAARMETRIATTLVLADIIEKAVPRRLRSKIHPATRTFQALRIAVNDELGELERALDASIKILKPGGRMIVVTFHSLEDRIVKNFFKNHSEKPKAINRYKVEDKVQTQLFEMIMRGAVQASDEESKINPRARSAKLRAAIRTEVVA